jgi:hypothetical protein
MLRWLIGRVEKCKLLICEHLTTLPVVKVAFNVGGGGGETAMDNLPSSSRAVAKTFCKKYPFLKRIPLCRAAAADITGARN